MKKVVSIILCLLFAIVGFSACADTGQSENSGNGGNGGGTRPPAAAASNVLVAYFSCTGTTEGIAKAIADETDGELHKILPEDPYTEEDLDYYSGGRADREQADASARPQIANAVENIEDYDIIFLGYPI